MTAAHSGGYADRQYALSLSEFGRPLALPASGGWLLERPIGETGFADAVGPYPFFACDAWAHLGDDLGHLDSQLVSVGIVTDPFGEFVPADLHRAFPARVTPYKQHFVVDLRAFSEATLDAHHRRNVRWASKRVAVVPCDRPLAHLEAWEGLYGVLRERHGVTGMARFSKAAFALQLAQPDLVAMRATADGETVGMVLWLCRDDVAYYHLAAYNERGYALKASFALFQAAIDHFAANGRRWLALGAGAGVVGDNTDGLTRFKAGWANGQRQVYFCGRIGQPVRYDALSAASGAGDSPYFPAYRDKERR
jgi:hypothetical protein